MHYLEQVIIEKLGCIDPLTDYVINVEGTEKGVIVATSDEGCEIESCRGTVHVVGWQDGEITHCCTHGMKALSDNVWQIEV